MTRQLIDVTINKKKYNVKKLIKNYTITRINTHNIVCEKVYHEFIPKYKRYIKKNTTLKVYNSTSHTPVIGQKVVLGYLGMRVCKTKSHTIVSIIEPAVSGLN